MIGIGVIGYGYWGPNLARNFAEASGARLAAISDLDAARLEKAGRRYPGVALHRDPADLLRDPAVHAVAISTPVSTHAPLALAALEAGKHVFVEKPLAASSAEGLRLIEAARKRKRVLMVDHTFVYTGAVRKIRELVASGQLGDVYYYDSTRINLGIFQGDVNVLWDLAVHDLAIMDYILDVRPCAVSSTGISHVPGGTENIAYMTLYFDGSLIAHLSANWLAPVKVRRTLISGSRKMIVYDDLEPSEKVKVYDRGITVDNAPERIHQLLIGYRSGDMWAPQLEITEALATEAKHFVDCIEKDGQPTTDGESGLRVVRILEAAARSMKERGRPVEIGG